MADCVITPNSTCAADEERRHDQGRDDLDQVVVAGGEEAEVAVHGDDALQVLAPARRAAEQRSADPLLAAKQRHRLGVLAHVDQSARKFASWSD